MKEFVGKVAQALTAAHPIGRVGHPEEVAELVTWHNSSFMSLEEKMLLNGRPSRSIFLIRSLEGKHPGMLVLYLHRIQLNLGPCLAMLSVAKNISLQIWMAAEL